MALTNLKAREALEILGNAKPADLIRESAGVLVENSDMLTLSKGQFEGLLRRGITFNDLVDAGAIYIAPYRSIKKEGNGQLKDKVSACIKEEYAGLYLEYVGHKDCDSQDSFVLMKVKSVSDGEKAQGHVQHLLSEASLLIDKKVLEKMAEQVREGGRRINY